MKNIDLGKNGVVTIDIVAGEGVVYESDLFNGCIPGDFNEDTAYKAVLCDIEKTIFGE